LALFPSKDMALEKAEKVFAARKVHPLPQLLAILIDYIVVSIIWFIISFIFRIDDVTITFLYKLVGMFFLQFVMPLLFGGKTIGTIVLRFQLEKEHVPLSWGRILLKRWIGLMAPWILGHLFLEIIRFPT